MCFLPWAASFGHEVSCSQALPGNTLFEAPLPETALRVGCVEAELRGRAVPGRAWDRGVNYLETLIVTGWSADEGPFQSAVPRTTAY